MGDTNVADEPESLAQSYFPVDSPVLQTTLAEESNENTEVSEATPAETDDIKISSEPLIPVAEEVISDLTKPEEE